MKKLTALILALAVALALCACSGGDNAGANTQDNYEPDYGELYYASGDVKFGIMDPAEEVLAALGEPDSTFESNSCAYQGKDKFYYYSGFEILVNDVDGVERITGITLADDTVSNPQGVKIGMKTDEALALMDAMEYIQAGDTYKFVSGSAMLRIQSAPDATVSAVEYTVAANDE